MTEDTIASPGHDGAVAPSTVTTGATAPAVSDAANRDSDRTGAGTGTDTGVVLVEEISIDGMCGVY